MFVSKYYKFNIYINSTVYSICILFFFSFGLFLYLMANLKQIIALLILTRISEKLKDWKSTSERLKQTLYLAVIMQNIVTYSTCSLLKNIL